jgi:hypothetical protein
MAEIGESAANLYFSDGTAYSVPLPEVARAQAASRQIALTEEGMELIMRMNITTFAENEENQIRSMLHIYSITYNDIKNGAKDWKLGFHSPNPTIYFELAPLGNNRYLGCLANYNGFHAIRSINSRELCDWIIINLDEKNRRIIELSSGNWLDDGSSFMLDPITNNYVSKYTNLTTPWDSTIVHTKNYLTICNLRAGMMLVFSKETGKLTRRIKLTEAVPPEHLKETVCAVPITIIQPDLDDGLVVLARRDIDLLESVEIIEKMEKARLLEQDYEASMLFREYQRDKNGAEWYRVNLKNGKISKLNSPDVPDTWNHNRLAPIFVPYEYDQILFGGLEKGFRELIGQVFKEPAKMPKPDPDSDSK